ncbi:glycosyltransferase family 4 protein [Aeromonas allosaccharophila]|uniref:glycosyltransferase family 4 protein n=1 Tax=Aeromonas allosaccharophila TaxID=656 RepID=UPI003AF79F03
MKKILIVSFYDLNSEDTNGVTKIGFNLLNYKMSKVDTLRISYSPPNRIISLIKYIVRGKGVFNDYLYRSQLIENIKLIEDYSENYDIVHLLGPQFLYLNGLLSDNVLKKIVLQPIDNLLIFKGRLIEKVNLARKIFYTIEVYKLKALYRELNGFKKIIFVSMRDSRLFNRISNLKSISIENGVNLKFNRKSDFEIKETDNVKLIFHGDLTYAPNIEAVYFLQALSEKLGRDFRIDIIGKYSEKLKLDCDGVNFIGFVDDLSNYLTSYDLYLCPIFSGAGIKNKFLEASYMRIPMISTREAAVGTSLKFGIDYEQAESLSDFISCIKRLSNDKPLREFLAENASLKVEQSFSWCQVIERYEKEYNEVYFNNNTSVG